MYKWQKFEFAATEYLKNNFTEYANFTLEGKSNSNISDIKVNTKTGKIFFIDAKLSPAQSGQFVLLPDMKLNKFEYSKKNHNKINIYTEKIIEYMNNNFNKFKNLNTNGEKIIIDESTSIFSNWIIENYKCKNTHFFITNDFLLLPIENINNYFDITAKYRIKRSGSSSIGKRNNTIIKKYIEKNYQQIKQIEINNNKLFIFSEQDLHNKRFILSDNEYMFSKRENKYELRKLSNTFNANVIFSIKLKQKNNQKGISDKEFITYLK